MFFLDRPSLFSSFFLVLQEKRTKDVLSKKKEKDRKGQSKNDDDDLPTELLSRPKDYVVKFNFPDPPPLQPPILGLYSKCEEGFLLLKVT
jgi:hypothetical protein